MDKVEEINNAVVELWEEEFGNDKHERMPLIYPPPTKRRPSVCRA